MHDRNLRYTAAEIGEPRVDPSGKKCVQVSLLLTTATVAFVVADIERCAACSIDACGVERLLPDGGTIPSNTPGFLWRRVTASESSTGAEGVTLALHEAAGARRVAVRLDLLAEASGTGSLVRIAPSEALVENASYTLSVPDDCRGVPDARLHAEFKIGPAKAVPVALGNLTASVKHGIIAVDNVASCTSNSNAVYADVTLDATAETAAYEDVLRYEVFVDGARSPNAPHERSEIAARVYALCGAAEAGVIHGVEPGVHRVRMTALLPDDTRIFTQEVEVDLSCAPAATSVPRVQRTARCDAGSPGAHDPTAWWAVFGGLAWVLSARRRNAL